MQAMMQAILILIRDPLRALPRLINSLALCVIAAAMLLGVVGCSQDSAPENNIYPEQPVPQGEPGAILYKGPPPSAAEAKAYQEMVWVNLARGDRCGACHIENGQPPQFARGDDIDQAFNAASRLIDTEILKNSRFVTKVGSGHNCWAGEPQVCADTLEQWLTHWRDAVASALGQEIVQQAIVLEPPAVKAISPSLPIPEDPAAFEQYLYTPYLSQHCAECHTPDAETPQQPYFASSNLAVAYEAVKSKIKLSAPERSRLVVRLDEESHNCWTASCRDDANDLARAIAQVASTVNPTEVDPAFITSNAVVLTSEGQVANTGGRVENNIIAKYEFKTGRGKIAYDTSGVEPALNLEMTGDVEWLEGGVWGIKFFDNDAGLDRDNGRAQGSVGASGKIHRAISFTREYSIEAWVAPANVTQDNSARIVSYSAGGDDARNFTLGQTLYNYDFKHRTTATNLNGDPMLSTPNADEVLQATLQHVVVTFNVLEGRKIYVNGQLISEDDAFSEDAEQGDGEGMLGSIDNWSRSYAFMLGSETSGNSAWLGTLRFLGIHNRALSAESVQANFESGVGEKFFLLFRVTEALAEGVIPGNAEAYIVFETEPFDSHSYLFASPKFYVMNPDNLTDSAIGPAQAIDIAGLRIGINGQEPAVGQAFANLEATVTADQYIAGEGQLLSRLAALIPVEQGKDSDEFFLTFDRLTTRQYNRPDPAVPILPVPAETEEAHRAAHIGIKTFDEINSTLAQLTGVTSTHPGVAETFAKVKQQLPVSPNIEGFLPAHHMGITQLAVAYCNALVSDTALRAARFPGFDFNANPATAFNAAGRQILADNLGKALVVASPGAAATPGEEELASGPAQAELSAEIDNLLNRMTACGTRCPAGTTPNTVTAACAAAFGSAAMLIQ